MCVCRLVFICFIFWYAMKKQKAIDSIWKEEKRRDAVIRWRVCTAAAAGAAAG
jgi:hypothetical protein